jgi:hypothetical protein
MNVALAVMIALLVGAFAVAFYMDWLGLWVSKEELQKQIARSKERTQASGESREAASRASGGA